MNSTSRIKWAGATAGATALAAAAVVMGASGPASAATGSTTICAPNYKVHYELPQQGSSGDIPRGVCQYIPLESGTSYVKVWGYWNTNPGTFYVGTGHPQNPGSTWFTAAGSTTSPYLTMS